MNPRQYVNFSNFSNIGTVGSGYIASVYRSLGYIEVVATSADQSMKRAVDEVKSLPEYTSNGVEWVITDACHDSTANAYHTTVPCLSGSTHRIVGCITISRKEHATAQTREVMCTKSVIPQVIDRDKFLYTAL
jgi:hypothetical protein